MAKFVVSFDTDNAAFEDYSGEIARILRAVADKVENGVLRGTILDFNGNGIGSYMPKGRK